MNKYLVKKKFAKYVRRSLVLLGKDWSEEKSFCNKIRFFTDLGPEKFKSIMNNAKHKKKADDKGVLIISFRNHPKKVGVAFCSEYIDGVVSIRRIDMEIKERNQKYLEEEVN